MALSIEIFGDEDDPQPLALGVDLLKDDLPSQGASDGVPQITQDFNFDILRNQERAETMPAY